MIRTFKWWSNYNVSGSDDDCKLPIVNNNDDDNDCDDKHLQVLPKNIVAFNDKAFEAIAMIRTLTFEDLLNHWEKSSLCLEKKTNFKKT